MCIVLGDSQLHSFFQFSRLPACSKIHRPRPMRGLFALGMFLGTLKDWISSPFASNKDTPSSFGWSFGVCHLRSEAAEETQVQNCANCKPFCILPCLGFLGAGKVVLLDELCPPKLPKIENQHRSALCSTPLFGLLL